MDPLIVFVRELVQNSWDARERRKQVRFSLDFRTLNEDQSWAVDKSIFNRRSAGSLPIDDALQKTGVQLLIARDSGTKGLGGPMRADLPISLGEPSDFIDLVFKVGQPPDRKHGGGTYGFGKTISFLVSEASATITYTRTRFRGRYQSRLIAAALGEQYESGRKTFTGRHWWGVRHRNVIAPLTGQAADRLAAAAGIVPFGAEETGTAIAVVAPRFEDRTPAQAMTLLGNALAWNFWPKVVPDPKGRRAMRFDVALDGVAIPFPSPDVTAPLMTFTDALRGVRCVENDREPTNELLEVHEIRSQRPSCHLGWLALRIAAVAPRAELDEGGEEDEGAQSASGFDGNAHHVALMRRAELVVGYLPGPELSSPAFEWAGVFKTSEEVDEAFAASEPPTHDGWISNLVPDRAQRTLVNVAMREIRRKIREAFVAPVPSSLGDGVSSAVVIGEALSGLLAGVPGSGASIVNPLPGRGNVSNKEGGAELNKRRTVRRSGEPTVTQGATRLSVRDGQRVTALELRVEAATGTMGSTVVVEADVATQDGSTVEKDPPTGTVPVRVLGFERQDGSERSAGSHLNVSAEDHEPWWALISSEADVAVSIAVQAQPEESA